MNVAMDYALFLYTCRSRYPSTVDPGAGQGIGDPEIGLGWMWGTGCGRKLLHIIGTNITLISDLF